MTVRVISGNTVFLKRDLPRDLPNNGLSRHLLFGESPTGERPVELTAPLDKTTTPRKTRSIMGKAYHAVVLAALTGLGIQSYNASNQLNNTQRELTATQTALSTGLTEKIQQLTQQEVHRQLPTQVPTMALTAINPNTAANLARVREATFEIRTVSTLFGTSGLGSGVLVMTNEGPMILTNKHVVSDAAENQAKNKASSSKGGNQCGIIPFDYKVPEGNGLNGNNLGNGLDNLPPLSGPAGSNGSILPPGLANPFGPGLFGSPKLGDLMENLVLPNRTIVVASSYQAPSNPTFSHPNSPSQNTRSVSGQPGATSTEILSDQSRNLLLSPRFISSNTDLALMKIENPTPDMGQRAIPIRDLLADPPVITEAVYAVGQPLGVEFYVSKGIISKEQYKAPGKDDNGLYLGTDTPINPGNSGGPLVDEYGRLIGLNSFIMTKSGASNGVGFTLRLDSIQDELSKNACIELLQPPAKK
ncbi:MAG: trypsin-like peptidase domain-containing protein [Cyanobacteria bacterium]|nr:trypsin-like peptidase domain-containing protein [Cyanobacteriota bacterium]